MLPDRLFCRTFGCVVAAALMLLFLVACDDTEEVTPGSQTPDASTQPASPTVPSSTPSSPTPTLRPVPSGWKDYRDDTLGLSLAYPGDLLFRDLTGPSPNGGLNERVAVLSSPDDPSRSIAISVSLNAAGLTPDEWLAEYSACLPDTLTLTKLGGTDAWRCTSDPHIPEAAIAFEQAGKIVYITSTMPTFGFEDEFEMVVGSIVR